MPGETFPTPGYVGVLVVPEGSYGGEVNWITGGSIYVVASEVPGVEPLVLVHATLRCAVGRGSMSCVYELREEGGEWVLVPRPLGMNNPYSVPSLYNAVRPTGEVGNLGVAAAEAFRVVREWICG